ncbi:MAG: CRISPR-associated helicase Cas3' [Syntrophobacteraceae bacterium]|nr:CRISPR-associated helicase Cas3' [Syntrophobacteraceae bacterium]
MNDGYLAHSANKVGDCHQLLEHLVSVGESAKDFASKANWADEAYLAGLLHDLGKYPDSFQARLRGEVKGLDHWSAGAWVSLIEFQAVAAALVIQGHHIGLRQGNNDALRAMDPALLTRRHPLNLKLSDPDIGNLKARSKTDGLIFTKPQTVVIDPRKGFEKPVAAMLDVRMLFSCLTDADFLDTEAHFEGDKQGKYHRAPAVPLNAVKALAALEAFMAGKIRGASRADKPVLDARDFLWEMAAKSAAREPGLFTLTAPTGSGKTLAMLKFALEHAAKNCLKRVILVVPFLSIIEQTAEIYRAVFQEFPVNFVLEHHSMAGLGIEEAHHDAEAANDRARRLLSENWDAPIIITTNVQLLESLFSNRPSACRKLHNLMESVVMFDEAQTLPQSLAVPTLAALSHLSRTYRTTVLFATATQPAFDALDGAVSNLGGSGWGPAEVAPDHARLYDALRRYEVRWPKSEECKQWAGLAMELRDEEQALCVVNLKSHAAALLEELNHDEAVFHLSTNLCALHRQAVMSEVRARLNAGEPCRLVSTQCVEAGVDVDFPVVYRALAPLDAIAQAAGRCNREGRLTDESGRRKMGEVRVFEPAVTGERRKRYPTRAYFQATEVTRTMLVQAGDAGLDLNDPAVFRDFYHRLYDIAKPETLNKELEGAMEAVDFARVAKEYRLIDNAAIQVLVPYRKSIEEFDELRRAQEDGINGQWIRRARGMAVGVYRPPIDHPAWGVLIPAKLRYGRGASDEWFILEDRDGEFYHDVFGLRLPQSQQLLIG